MIACNGSGDVANPDINNVWTIQTGIAGYLENDYNLNINVSNQDKNDYWFKNNGEATYIPD